MLKGARGIQHVVNSRTSYQMLCILMVQAPWRATRKSFLSGAFVFSNDNDPDSMKFRCQSYTRDAGNKS
jgi:hypothetical protein